MNDSETIILFVATLIFQMIALTLCHLFITKVSFMFVQSEVSRVSNLSLFDILKEKVFVVDQQSKEVLW